MKNKLIISGPVQYGYKTDTWHYCKYLASEFDITYIGFDEGKNKKDHGQSRVIYVPANNRLLRKIGLILQTVRSAKSQKGSVVFITYFRLASLINILLPFRKCILDFQTGSVSDNKLKNRFKNFNMWLESRFFKNIVTLSPDLKEHLKLPARTKILPLGSDQKSNTIKRFDALNLLYVGILNGRNIHETIIGVARFKENHPDVPVRYYIAGSGDSSYIQAEIIKYRLEDVVQVLGFVSDNESAYYYDICNMGVCYAPMTDYYLPQPFTKLYEYGMAGMAVISVKLLDSVRRVNENVGVLCDDNPESFALALEEIYNNRARYNSEAIREYFSPWTWENITKEFKKIIDE